MNRRDFTAAVAATALGLTMPVKSRAAASVVPPDHPLQASWRGWKEANLAPDGRVIDGLQSNASHSEGQGYGMTLAVSFGDASAFRSMLTWTEDTLLVRGDGLLAWRWTPDAVNPIPDRNNASDGDLFYGWALARAATLFGSPGYADRAEKVAQALAASCVVPHPDGSGRLLLAPAAEGFTTPEGVVVNPSYAMPRALRELGRATGVGALEVCADDADAMMADMAATGLTPDWAEIVAEGWRVPTGRLPASGYEAMRASLFLIWSGETSHPAVLRQAAAYAADAAPPLSGTPTVFQTATAEVLERSVHPGYAALAGLTRCIPGDEIGSTIPPFDANQPYYPATLHLMALLAQMELAPRCFPL